MFETIAFCRVPSSYLLLNRGIQTVTVWIFVSSWQDLFSTHCGMCHFKSRNEEIRNGNEEMGNEKK